MSENVVAELLTQEPAKRVFIVESDLGNDVLTSPVFFPSGFEDDEIKNHFIDFFSRYSDFDDFYIREVAVYISSDKRFENVNCDRIHLNCDKNKRLDEQAKLREKAHIERFRDSAVDYYEKRLVKETRKRCRKK